MTDINEANEALFEAAERARQQVQDNQIADLNEKLNGIPKKRKLDPDDPGNPDYYQFDYEHQQWDIAYEQWGAGALLAHALKYIMRCGKKPTSSMLRDVRNAINYLKHLEEKLVAEEDDE